jgi:tight adherence protein B
MIDGILAAILIVMVAFMARVAMDTVRARIVLARVTSSQNSEGDPIDFRSLIARLRPVTQRSYERQLPAILDAIALSLYSGSGFAQAIREASLVGSSPVVQDIRQVMHEVDLGESLADALLHWSQRVAYESVRLSAASMIMAIEAGGNYVLAVDAAAASVRRGLEAAATAKTNATQSRASAAALVMLPAAISVPLIIFNGDARSFMLHTVVGLTLLTAGIALDLLGWFWMQSLVKRALA